jgi:outer membrane protein TolC
MQRLQRISWTGALCSALMASIAAADEPAAPAPEKLSFADAVQRALSRSTDFMVARAAVQRAAALVQEARGAWLPNVSSNFVLTQYEGPRPEAGLPATQENLNLSISVPIVSTPQWAKTWAAEDALKVQQANEKDVRRQVAVAVARAYLSTLTQHRLIEVSEQAVTTAQAHYTYAHERYVQGIGNSIDVLRAQTEVATATSQLQTAQTGLVRLQEALGVLIAENGPIDTTDIPPLTSTPALKDALNNLQERRADLVALSTRLKTAKEEAHREWADYIPLLNVVFAPFLQNPAIASLPAKGYEAQVLLTIPLYDGGVRYGLQHEREALVLQSTGTWENAMRQASADVRSSFETVRRTDEVLRTAQDAAQLATKTLELTTLAYKTGAIDNLQVVDAERQARDAESSVVIAEDGSRQARLDLLSASGRFPEGP